MSGLRMTASRLANPPVKWISASMVNPGPSLMIVTRKLSVRKLSPRRLL